MCGRHALIKSLGFAEASKLGLVGEHETRIPFRGFDLDPAPRYNITPTQPSPIIRLVDGELVQEEARWGLLTPWSGPKDRPLNNARADTVAEKPSFRDALRLRRCLVPSSWFYEWERPERTPKGQKQQPWKFAPAEDEHFLYAGLWGVWRAPEGGDPILSYTVITTTPNPLVERVHDRMPVILPPEGARRWLDPDVRDPKDLTPLLVPYPAERMTAAMVSKRLNQRGVDDASVLVPDAPAPEQPDPGGQLRLF